MMKIKKHIVNVLQTNCYVVWDEMSNEGFVIDPGGSAKKIRRTLAEKEIALKAIIHTHSHWDHTSAQRALQRATGAPLYRHPDAARSGFLHRPKKADGKKVIDLVDGYELFLGHTSFRAIHTPGHSRGCTCLYSEGILFSGDLLFQGSVGRWDMKGGSFRELIKSLKERLADLPDDTDVMPGHGPATTLGKERRTNTFFRASPDLEP